MIGSYCLECGCSEEEHEDIGADRDTCVGCDFCEEFVLDDEEGDEDE